MNKTALITGASSGIGREMAIIHAERGGDLILVARSESKLYELKKELEKKYQVRAEVIASDLTEPNATEEVYNKVKEMKWEVDFLINNAGFGGIGKFDERDIHEDKKMIELNIVALTTMTYYFLRDMKSQNRGKILNVSSTASLMPGPLQAVYFATKAYVTSFSNALSEELSDTQVTVTNLMPGPTETQFGKISGMDKTPVFKHTADARKVALKGYEAMLNGKMDVVVGLSWTQRVLTSLIPLAPKWLVLKQMRKRQTTIE